MVSFIYIYMYNVNNLYAHSVQLEKWWKIAEGAHVFAHAIALVFEWVDLHHTAKTGLLRFQFYFCTILCLVLSKPASPTQMYYIALQVMVRNMYWAHFVTVSLFFGCCNQENATACLQWCIYLYDVSICLIIMQTMQMGRKVVWYLLYMSHSLVPRLLGNRLCDTN